MGGFALLGLPWVGLLCWACRGWVCSAGLAVGGFAFTNFFFFFSDFSSIFFCAFFFFCLRVEQINFFLMLGCSQFYVEGVPNLA